MYTRIHLATCTHLRRYTVTREEMVVEVEKREFVNNWRQIIITKLRSPKMGPRWRVVGGGKMISLIGCTQYLEQQVTLQCI